MTPIGDYNVEHNQPEEEVIKLSTEIWSTSCNKEFLDKVLNMLEYDLVQGFPDYSVSIDEDIDTEYADFDDINDEEFENIFRCLKYETFYFTIKELKEGNKSV